MNSRFNLSLREKYGLVYSIDAGFSSYIDTGFFSIFFATDQKNLNKAIRLINKEMQILREKPLGGIQLKTLKDQLMGQLAMSEESNQGYMLMMARSILDLNKIESLQDIFHNLGEITAPQIQDLANEMFDEKLMSRLIFMPELE